MLNDVIDYGNSKRSYATRCHRPGIFSKSVIHASENLYGEISITLCSLI